MQHTGINLNETLSNDQNATPLVRAFGEKVDNLPENSLIGRNDCGLIIREDGTFVVFAPGDVQDWPNEASEDTSDKFATLTENLKKLTALAVALSHDQVMAVLLNLSHEIGAVER